MLHCHAMLFSGSCPEFRPENFGAGFISSKSDLAGDPNWQAFFCGQSGVGPGNPTRRAASVDPMEDSVMSDLKFSEFEFPALSERGLHPSIGVVVVGDNTFGGVVRELAFVVHRY